jgi:hypothetical protein
MHGGGFVISWLNWFGLKVGLCMSDDMKQRRGVRSAFGDMAKEMGFAVNSIRQEVVERPWFGREVTPEIVQDWDKENPSAEDKELEGPQDFSRDDLYGQDIETEPDRDREIDRDIER